ncbi:MAG: TonB-dependent receptor [bacterium]
MAGKTKRIIKIFKNITVIIFFTFYVFSSFVESGTDSEKGSIEGRIVSGETGKPLKGANVTLTNISKTETDSTGSFIFESIPVGLYRLEVSFIGYSPVTVDVLSVTEDTIINITVELLVNPVESDDIIVAGKYNRDPLRTTINSTTIKPEAITDLPGSFGDITRAISNNISLSKIDDRYNSMNVRGGSAIENGYYIDNIEISNMNHFPSQGSGNGPLGFLRADLIDDVVFHTGGFPVQYGNKLSSIMDIKMRKGGEDGFHAIGNLDLTGISATIEGAVNNNRGNWLLSSRRGFLGDLIKSEGDFDYFDFEGRGEYQINSKSNLALLVLGGIGKFDFSQSNIIDTSEGSFGLFDYTTGLIGVNWVHQNSGKAVLQTSFAYSYATWKNDEAVTTSNSLLFENDSKKEVIKLRNSSYVPINDDVSVNFGFDIDYNIVDFDYTIGSFVSSQGYGGSRVDVDVEDLILTGGMFFSLSKKFYHKITIDCGLRLDHSEFNNYTHLSPRVGLSYDLNENHKFYSCLGVYTQNLPLMLVLQHPDHKDLNNPEAVHIVLGWKANYQNSISLGVEYYNKQYSNLPMDKQDPQAFILDELVWNYGFMAGHRYLISEGESYTEGVEITAGIPFSQKLSSQFAMSLFRSRYKDLNDDWRNRVGDNKLLVNVLLNYQPSDSWSLFANWIFAGGIPYTPTYEYSNFIVYQPQDINRSRLPDYHVLNMRGSKSFKFSKSTLSLYLELLNIYNRNNISVHDTDADRDSREGDRQLPFLPIVGMEYSF